MKRKKILRKDPVKLVCPPQPEWKEISSNRGRHFISYSDSAWYIDSQVFVPSHFYIYGSMQIPDIILALFLTSKINYATNL